MHALVGENGAGKSTLMKILAGVYRADAGTVELDGEAVSFDHPLQAQAAGVATVFQEFNLLPERSVAENVFLGREPRRRGLVDRERMVRETDRCSTSPRRHRLHRAARRVGSLSVAEQQVVEIVKAISHDARIISMDEPTAALADNEVELLYRIVRRLGERGVAVLYVSHRLKEIFDLCDRITVLKDGALVRTVRHRRDHHRRSRPARWSAGRSPASSRTSRRSTTIGDVRLRRARRRQRCSSTGSTCEVRAGEIVGLAGLQGSGRTEIAHALFGVAAVHPRRGGARRHAGAAALARARRCGPGSPW